MAAEQAQQIGLRPEQVAAGTPANAQLVDVRTDAEHEAARIPDARHIPIERLQEEAGTLDRERPVVFYCRSGDRSTAAAEAFRASGWEAHSIEGGLSRWAEEGLPLEPETAEVIAPSGLPPR
jgi:rhodanese-related sulfurtransferase